jgi:hypothetical protein
MFNDANGEHIFVYAKMEPWIPILREQMGNPRFLAHLEKTVKALPDCEERLAVIRDRIQKLIAYRALLIPSLLRPAAEVHVGGSSSSNRRPLKFNRQPG